MTRSLIILLGLMVCVLPLKQAEAQYAGPAGAVAVGKGPAQGGLNFVGPCNSHVPLVWDGSGAPICATVANSAPATSGATQTGSPLRVAADSANVLDFGINNTGSTYAWMQSALASNLSTNYSLLINPNGGAVGINQTTIPLTSFAVKGNVGIVGRAFTEYSIGNPVSNTGTWISTNPDITFWSYVGDARGIYYTQQYIQFQTTLGAEKSQSGLTISFNAATGDDPTTPSITTGISNIGLASANGGKIWAQANNLIIESGWASIFATNTEFDVSNAGGVNAEPVTGDANIFNLFLAGTVGTAPITAEIYVSANESPTVYGAWWGIAFVGEKTVKQYTFIDTTSSDVSLLIAGTHISGIDFTQAAAFTSYQIRGIGWSVDGDGDAIVKSLAVPGSSSGSVSVVAQATAGTPTLTLPNTSGTFAVGASAPLSLSATTGALTCPTCTTSAASLTANQLVIGSGSQGMQSLGSLGTTTTVLHGNAAGAPSFGAVVSADLNITTTSCTNQFVTAISAGGVGTCTTNVLASAQHANQGTTTTVLHGNASGNPSWGAVAISTDVSGLGTNVATWLGTPSSANLAAAVTDETGTGALVFGTSPTLTTSASISTGASNNFKVSQLAGLTTFNCLALNDNCTGSGGSTVGMFGGDATDGNLYLTSTVGFSFRVSGADITQYTSTSAAFLRTQSIPAGGTQDVGLLLSSTAHFGVFFGSGAPSLSAAKGSLYLRSDGTTTNDRAYINTNGSTTWTNLTTGS